MTHRSRPMKMITYTLLLGLLLHPAATALAGNDFGDDWQPRPLVDTSAKTAFPTQQSSAPAVKPSAPVQPDLEAKLKPAEPFIKDVETKLFIKPKSGASLVSRLDTLQTVLFGEAKYQDASELLSKLAEIFPQEAAKAQTGLHQQILNSQPVGPSSAKSQAFPTNQDKPTVYSPTNGNPSNPMPQQSQYAPQYAPSMATAPQSVKQSTPKPKKKHFWQDDWENDFENDPFFNDSLNSSNQSQQQQASSKLGSVGQGLAGLAMMAGGVAGTYYLNKKLGNNTLPNNQQYYNSPYYGNYGNYGYPYGSNQYYGNGYAVPYGYGTYAVPYGSVGYPPPPPGAYGSPYGGVITSQPYRPYGSSTSTFGGVSPLGVPTGF